MTTLSPAAILLFADSRGLPALEGEEHAVRRALDPLVDSGSLSEVYVVNNAGIDAIVDTFRIARMRRRPLIVHFGGHAGEEGIMLRSRSGTRELADGLSLAGYVGAQSQVMLVFLNGCATRSLVEELRDNGAKAVIATSHLIEDDCAAEFARHFYAELSDRPLSEAFRVAELATKIRWRAVEEGAWPWILSVEEGHEGWAPTAQLSTVEPAPIELEDLVMLARRGQLYRPLRRRRVLRELQRSTISQHAPRLVILKGDKGSGRSALVDDLAYSLVEQPPDRPVRLLRARPELLPPEIFKACAALSECEHRAVIHLPEVGAHTEQMLAHLHRLPHVHVLLSLSDAQVWEPSSAGVRATYLKVGAISDELLAEVLSRAGLRLGIDVDSDAIAELIRLAPAYEPGLGGFGAALSLLEDASAYAEFPSTGYGAGYSEQGAGRITAAIVGRVVALRRGTH